MRVIVTRPAPEAQRWSDGLRAHGIQADALPLIAIGPAPSGEALAAVRAQLAGHRAVMFVSGNAVTGLLGGKVPAWPPDLRAWAPGPGTREALLAAGVPRSMIDAPAEAAAQFDSEALWQVVASQVSLGDSVLVVRGGDAQGRAAGRDWLSARLAEAGVVVESVVSYTRQLPTWDAGAEALARAAASDGSLWLFSSSEAARNLERLLPGQDWGGARALVSHPRIADAAHALGYGSVRIARPTLADVVASIESQR